MSRRAGESSTEVLATPGTSYEPAHPNPRRAQEHLGPHLYKIGVSQDHRGLKCSTLGPLTQPPPA